MEDGLVSPVHEGRPQGGPLSPLLSNLALDELDRELERRGHRFVRYADDGNIYVSSERAGQRGMESVTRFITHRLKLKVNQAKSAVARPGKGSFSDSASPANENQGGALPPRRSLALRSGFENRPGEHAASACGRGSKSLRPTSAAGSGTAKRPRCCKALKRGYAADFGRWCGGNGSRDERGFANFANGVWARTWRRKPPGVPTARGVSQTRPPWPLLCRMLTLPSSDSRPWSCGPLNPPNRRMRTRMSGGVAGEAGRPVPLCRFPCGQTLVQKLLTAGGAENAEKSSLPDKVEKRSRSGRQGWWPVRAGCGSILPGRRTDEGVCPYVGCCHPERCFPVYGASSPYNQSSHEESRSCRVPA